MFKSTKKGNIAVETAIILPFVILGILTIAYLIKINCNNESIMSMAVDETRRLSIESYTNIGRVSAAKFPVKLKHRIEEKSNSTTVKIRNFKYLYSKGNLDNLISFNVEYKNNCNFPIPFYGSIWEQETVMTRAFVGSNNYNKAKGFSSMEKLEDSEIVWIFPLAGKKYHKKDCPYIKVAATQTILTKNIKKRYKPCSVCNSKEIPEGSLVYCFFNSGKSYHRANCYIVDRYVIPIEKSEAIERGYTPCLKCGGT